MTSSSTSSNPFGDFMDLNARTLRELPLANEPDLFESLNTTLPSQQRTLHPEKQSGMNQVQDFFGSNVANQLKSQDEETRKLRIRILEQNELTRLKNIVERWEVELQHVFNQYQDSILRNLLCSTKERIRILEELELTGTDLSLLQELRNRVEELNEKGDRAINLMKENFQGVEKALSSRYRTRSRSIHGFRGLFPTLDNIRGMGMKGMNSLQNIMQHPMETAENARQHAMEIGDRWRTSMMSYQDQFGNFVAFFMVLFFGNLTWRDRGHHLLHGLQNLSLYMIDKWRQEIQDMDRESALQSRRQQFKRDRMGLLGLFFSYAYSLFMFPLKMIGFFWFFGWATWTMNIGKRTVVSSYDYLFPIFSTSQPFNDKVLHVIHDAKTNLEDKSTHFSENVKSSIAKGTHSLETATDKYVQNDKVKDGLKKALGAVDSLLAKTQTQADIQRSGSEQEVPLISKKKKRSGISSSGISGTSSPVVGKR